LAFEIYGPALRGDFLFDDTYLPFFNPEIAKAPLRQWLGVRPFLMLSYWINYQTAGLNPYPYHAVNIVFHALNSILAYMIVRKVLEFVAETAKMREVLAAFSGLLFLVHPVQTESVAYIASRSEAMSVFFFLSAFALFLYRKGAAIGWPRTVAVLMLFGIACTVKEHTTVLPALLLLTELCFNSGPTLVSGIRRNLRLYVPLAACGLLGLVAVWRVLSAAESAGFGIKEFTWYQYLFTQFRSVWLYLRLYVAPFGQNSDYDWTISRSITEQGSLFGLAGLLVLAVLAWRYRREYPLASYGFFGFLILLAPTSSIVPIRDVAVERRLYLPFICLLFVTVDLLRRWRTTPTVMAAMLGVICTVAAYASYQRNHVYAGAIPFWEDVVQKSPRNARAWFHLAYAQWQAGKCQEAVANYEKTAGLQPTPDDRLLLDWAHALDCADRPDEAVTKLRQAAKLAPGAHIYSQIGMIYGKRDRVPEALEALAMAEKLNPRFEMTFVYRGNIYANRGSFETAAREYKRALALNPANEAARKGLVLIEQQLSRQQQIGQVQ
jgi:tetratricopeptide (TPR) repeat protein